jgi:hypothetical protein
MPQGEEMSVIVPGQFRHTCVNGKWTCPTAPCQELSERGRIPIILAEEAYKEYAAQFGTQQSLARLNERGGFGADELAHLLFDRIKRLEMEQGE